MTRRLRIAPLLLLLGFHTHAQAADCGVSPAGNDSATAPGLGRWSIKAGGATAPLPSPDAVRLTAVVGAAGECAEIVFSDPGGAKPRCTTASERISCR